MTYSVDHGDCIDLQSLYFVFRITPDGDGISHFPLGDIEVYDDEVICP